MPVQTAYTFDASQDSYRVSISVIDDDIVEQSETFGCNIRLSSGMERNVMIFQSTAEVNIEDNDSKWYCIPCT